MQQGRWENLLLKCFRNKCMEIANDMRVWVRAGVSVCDLTHMFKILWQRPLQKFLCKKKPFRIKSKPQKLYFPHKKKINLQIKFHKRRGEWVVLGEGAASNRDTRAYFQQGVWLQILHERLPETERKPTQSTWCQTHMHTHRGQWRRENRQKMNKMLRK